MQIIVIFEIGENFLEFLRNLVKTFEIDCHQKFCSVLWLETRDVDPDFLDIDPPENSNSQSRKCINNASDNRIL